MIQKLAPALAVQCEQTLLIRRGGRDSLTGATGRAPKLTSATHPGTTLYLRKLATSDLLGELFAVTPHDRQPRRARGPAAATSARLSDHPVHRPLPQPRRYCRLPHARNHQLHIEIKTAC